MHRASCVRLGSGCFYLTCAGVWLDTSALQSKRRFAHCCCQAARPRTHVVHVASSASKRRRATVPA
eukprot:5080110-Amphidinium_carterae.1